MTQDTQHKIRNALSFVERNKQENVGGPVKKYGFYLTQFLNTDIKLAPLALLWKFVHLIVQ